MLKSIRDEFGSEEDFDTFVRKNLPRVLARSKREYRSRITSVALDVVDLVFGN